MRYHWQQSGWPNFRFKLDALEGDLQCFEHYSGRVGGLLEGLPEGLGSEAVIDLMISEAITTSAIEGEVLEPEDVKSSIRNHLGLNSPSRPVGDARAEGAGELMVVVRESFAEPLGIDMLFDWHAILMKGERSVRAGAWREGEDPMQVVSGRIDRPTVHYEAPPSCRIPDEMDGFVEWFNSTSPGGEEAMRHAPVRAGIAHLYFESIHPFEDGNGRIGRAIAEKALSQGLAAPALLSLSHSIEAKRRKYYDALQRAQRSLEVTEWLVWFTRMVLDAQRDAEERMMFILRKSKFFERFRSRFNERQLKVVRRMLDSGHEGFEGGMSARKYVALAKVSKATATRDLQQLAEMEAVRSVGGGRSTRYELNL